MTDEQLLDVFDRDGPEEALLRLAVVCPSFGAGDLLAALRRLRDMSDPRDSVREALRLFSNSSFGSWGMASAAHPLLGGFSLSDAIRSRREEALRTVFRVMFETNAWDDEILFRPGFLDEVSKLKRECRDAARAAGYRDRRVQDAYEAFAEMEDRLAKKITLYSGA